MLEENWQKILILNGSLKKQAYPVWIIFQKISQDIIKKIQSIFFGISQSSAAEVKSMSYMLEDTEYLEPDDIKELREKAEKTRNLTLGLIRYVDNKKWQE